MQTRDNKFPRQTMFIVGNEACERFSFYGMRSLLAVYMTSQLLMTEDMSTTVVHLFLAGVYLMPLLGGWIADRFWGRYNTILWISLFYCLGHGILATEVLVSVAENLTGDELTVEIQRVAEIKKWILFSGMALIAFGSGGIKPCVSAFMGDQFKPEQSFLLPKAYAAFYWSVNLGSFSAFMIIPWLKDSQGWGWAFGVPGIAMAIATFIFWSGRKQYVRVPPQGNEKKDSLLGIWWHCLTNRQSGRKFWDAAKGKFNDESIENARSIIRILKVFALVPPFWALFDQTASSWLLQGTKMEPVTLNLYFTEWTVQPAQLQAANPVFVMLLIPFLTFVVYPRIKWLSSPLRRMSAGMLFSAVAYGIVALLQFGLETGHALSLAWQLLPYLVLTVAEVLISTTGLEFAFTQAPKTMKSMVTSFWNLTIFAGNILVSLITWILAEEGQSNAISSGRFLSYGALTFVVAFAFMGVAYYYHKEKPEV